MNWRAAGCLLVGAVLFVGIGLLGLWRATSQTGCFDELHTADGVYRAAGTAAPTPALTGGEQPVEIGTTLVGLATRRVYAPAGTNPNDPNAPRPSEVAVECGDGTFQPYLLGPVASPS